MILRCLHNKIYHVSLSLSLRFVYEQKNEGKEKAPQQAEIPEGEKIDQRKVEARKEIDAIYGLGDYDTYNFRTLPQDFKDHLKKNFGQWIDAQISKYDEDKDSGINAAEYGKFKTELTKKVREILDRVAELKKEKQQEAKETKENAEAAKEAQKRLEGVDVTKLDAKNLESADGLYTELLKYQKDFEHEAENFGKLAVSFGDAKEKVDNANKPHHTGATALGEYLVSLAPWTEDSPEVKDAKKAKADAIQDFQTKLSEMKKRQKERQQRGETLNGSPENVRGKVRDKYKKDRDTVQKHLDDTRKKKEENDKEKVTADTRLTNNLNAQKELQHRYDVLAVRVAQVAERRKKAEEESQVVEKAEEGIVAAEGQIAKAKEQGKELPAEYIQKVVDTKEQLKIASSSLEEGKVIVGGEEISMGNTLMSIQGQISRVIADTGKTKKAIDTINLNDTALASHIEKLNTALDSINTGEKEELAMVDSLDESIASSVLEVDTANFEIIKKGENYLKMLKQMDVKGPGVLDTAGAMLKGIPGVESGTNWMSKKGSALWDGMKKTPVLGDAIQIVGYMGEGWMKGWDAIGSGLTWLGDKMHLQEAWDWMSEASKHLSIGNPTGNPAVDAILDTFSGGGLGTIIEVFAGVTEGCKDLVKGIGMMARNPLDALKGIAHLVNHPSMIIDSFIQKDKWGEESVSKIIGRAMVDVVTTLSGAGATASAVKVSIAAAKIGGMSVGRAALLGARTFAQVFVKDITGMVVGVVKLPATLAKGTGRFVLNLASGGKKLEPIEGAASKGAKAAASAEEAYKAVEAARGKPKEFEKLMREHPEYAGMHADHAHTLEKSKKAEMKSKPQDDVTKKGEDVSKKTDEKSATKKDAEESHMGGEHPEKKTLAAEERTAPVGSRGKKQAETKITEEAEAAAKKEKVAEQLKVEPDFSVKPKTPERTNMIATLETRVKDHPGLKAAAQTMGPGEFIRFVDALPTEELRLLESSIDNLDSTLIQRIVKQEYQFTVNSKGEKVRVYTGEVLGQGGFGVVTDCAFVAGKGETLSIGALKRPKDTSALKAEVGELLDMLRSGELSPSEIKRLEGEISDLSKKTKDTTIPKEERFGFGRQIDELNALLRDKKINDAYKKQIHARMAGLNFQINSIMRNFDNELVAMRIVEGMGDVPGLIKPRMVSAVGEPMIITEKIIGKPGEDVVLKKRMFDDSAANNPADILQYLNESLGGLDALHERGFVHLDFKPENVFVGSVNGAATKGYLGDLALLSVEQLAELRIIPAGAEKIGEKSVPKYAVIQPSASGRIADSKQIGITPGYFSAEHLNALIEQAKKAVADARAKGVDPGTVKLPKEVIGMADYHQVGESINRYCNFIEGVKDGAVVPGRREELAKKWGVTPDVLAEVAADLRKYGTELKKADGKMTIPEVMVAIESARARLRAAGAKPSELPSISI